MSVCENIENYYNFGTKGPNNFKIKLGRIDSVKYFRALYRERKHKKTIIKIYVCPKKVVFYYS